MVAAEKKHTINVDHIIEIQAYTGFIEPNDFFESLLATFFVWFFVAVPLCVLCSEMEKDKRKIQRDITFVDTVEKLFTN